MRKIELTGRRFSRWTVVEEVDKRGKESYWLCKCDCGVERSVSGNNLRAGKSTSCGCLGLENMLQSVTHHGLSKHPLHSKWSSMIARCYNPNNKRYMDYGGRGITVCEEWRNDFMSFYTWSISNGWSPELTIDREKNDGNYEPGNCRWADRITQARNRRSSRIITCRGMTMTLAAFAELVGEKSDIIHYRIRHGWSEEDAIFTPFKRRSKHETR